MRKHNPLITAVTAGALMTLPSLAAATEVVTSIKPLELLVHAIAGEDTHTSTIVPAGSSPHTYTMKPSQRRAMEKADVIFWVGPEMESFLTRLLSGEDFHAKAISLISEDNSEYREAEDNHRDEEHSGHSHGTHDHGEGEDPHIWTDPQRAVEMAEKIRDALAELDGADKKSLDRNFTRFREQVAETESGIRARLTSVHDISLFAYHDAFTRFAEHYNLELADVLTLNPELSPGARHIAEVQTKLKKATHPCLLTEPQFNRQWWTSITRGLDVSFSTWDPLATDIEVTKTGYLDFQNSIADAVLKCLPENAQH
ncbi:Zinc ABC transporter, periplasmic-binding protein ZnuA [Marinobacter nitratireducens]|uniref:High-affinity zinc uptake system protein ZnuA n=1 Tax=Marinobacter nitratireducens TaxID=1137280 RepID=A0A072N2V1_9GAMM|nr:zinc ABC transporter substrate-binding protein [Marinobacter nitratireducens]KEF32009.1 Zinc ABC transporter, periplasmic-binding protein ZnuA [Marinobacter nitratireducens]